MLTRMSPALAVAKLGQHPFAVGRPDPDAVALLQPQRNQSRGEPTDRGLEFAIGQAHALVPRDHGLPFPR